VLLELIFILFFGIGDYVTTKYIMMRGGKEVNPLVFVIIRRYGFRGLALIKILMIIIVIFVYPEILLLFGTIVSIAVVSWNLYQCLKYVYR